jgi:hypothetical protein
VVDEPSPSPAEGAERHEGPWLALLLAGAAVVAAIIGARASIISGESSGLWQQAVRQEVKAAAAVVEDIRFVYVSEADQAYRVVNARVRAEEYRTAADRAAEPIRTLLLAEAVAQEQVAVALTSASEIAQDPRYARPDGGFDLVLRLADNRQRYPDLLATNPDEPQAAGDQLSRKAVLMTGATIPVAATFLFGALAQAFVRGRRLLRAAALLSLVAGVAAGLLVELAV